MKRYLVIALICTSVLFTGCNKASGENAVASEATENKEEAVEGAAQNETASEETGEEVAEEKTEVKVEDLVSDMFNEKGSTKVCYEEGNPDATYDFDFEFAVPEINDNSKDAKSINYEINREFAGCIEQAEALVKNNGEKEMFEPPYRKISYDAYINGDVLSIVIIADDAFVEWTTYMTYNYDYVNQKRLSNEEVIKLAGMTEDEFKEAVTNTIAARQVQVAEDMMGSLVKADLDEDSYDSVMLPDIIKQHYEAISDERNNGSSGIFLDGNGKLQMIGYVHVPAGAGYYGDILEISKDTKASDTSVYKKFYDEFKFPGCEMRTIGLYEDEGLDYNGTIKTENGESVEATFYMGNDMGNKEKFLYQVYAVDDGLGTNYEGTITFVDVTDEGMIFEYDLSATINEIPGQPDTLKGKFRAVPHEEYIEETDEFDNDVSIFIIEGDDLFNSDGKEIVAFRAVG